MKQKLNYTDRLTQYWAHPTIYMLSCAHRTAGLITGLFNLFGSQKGSTAVCIV